jgi:hypothetical protein
MQEREETIVLIETIGREYNESMQFEKKLNGNIFMKL